MLMFKQLIASFALAFTGAGVAADTQPVPVPAKVVTFKDWTVGCDNGLACQAVALLPDTLPENHLSLILSRPAGAEGVPKITISGATTLSDRYRIIIDNRVVKTGIFGDEKESLVLTDTDAVKLARYIARGNKLLLVDGDGQDLGSVSLAGTSATLRYIDSMQGRAGTRGAMIATGRRAARAKTVALPVISAPRIKPAETIPDAASLVALSESSPCAAERFGPTEDSAYSLGSGSNGPQALVLLNCGSGAYNFSVGAYVSQRNAQGKWSHSPARFDYAPNRLTTNGDLALLVNAYWDAATQTISGYNKGRGIGDCGSSQSYVWDGRMFRLSQATVMDECRGSLNWIPVWRTEVKLTD